MNERTGRRRAVRIAHLTDCHIQPERGAVEGVVACFERAQNLPDPPDFLFNGGDCIMDAVSADAERARVQWDLWERTVREHCQLPLFSCLGNHDIWGWNRKRSGCAGNEPLYGKKMALERLQMERSYYRFDHSGWRFFVLDSNHGGDGPENYTARLDPEQREWLTGELAATPATTPIFVISHIPLLGGGSLFFTGSVDENERTGDWVFPATWVHEDARTLHKLFVAYPNVRLCVSGHLHLHDRTDYNGIAYLCGGAVSGRWWRGAYHETPPGFAVIDLFTDGTFEYEYVSAAPVGRDETKI